jgi:hypothetical protein
VVIAICQPVRSMVFGPRFMKAMWHQARGNRSHMAGPPALCPPLSANRRLPTIQCLGDPSEPSSAPQIAGPLAAHSSHPAPDPPASPTGASP